MGNQSVYGDIVEKHIMCHASKSFLQRMNIWKTLGKGCYPLLPLTAYALLCISEKVAQNERTIFTFLAEEEQGSLSWLLQKGIEDFIGIDKIYDYLKICFGTIRIFHRSIMNG